MPRVAGPFSGKHIQNCFIVLDGILLEFAIRFEFLNILFLGLIVKSFGSKLERRWLLE